MGLVGWRPGGRWAADFPVMSRAVRHTGPLIVLLIGLDAEQRFTEIDRLLILGQNFDDRPTTFSRDFVEDLHRFDDADNGVLRNSIAHFDVGFRFGIGSSVKSADHGSIDS